MSALRIAASGMDAQQRRVEVISNNIANMSTTAFSSRRAEFADLHYQQIRPAGSISSTTGTIVPTGIQMGLGVRAAAVSAEVEQGALRQTGGDLDLAVEGRGYFEIVLPNGEPAYTRDGAFNRNAEGLLVNNDGFALAGNIVIPQDSRQVTINAEGEVFAFFDGQVEPQQLGVIDLVTFINEKGLRSIGSNLFQESPASGAPLNGPAGEDGRGLIRQGFLESSSVEVVEEIAELIEAQRGYELNSRVISAVDEMLSSTNQIR